MDSPKPLCPLFGLDQVVLGVLPTAVSPLAALCPFQRTRGWLHSSRGWDGGVSACIVSPLLSHTEVPTLCVLLPLGGLNIDSGGRGQPSCSCYHPPAPECHRWHQVQPQHQGRLAKPRRVAKDPKGRVLAQPCTHPALHPTSSHRARAGGPQLPPAPPGAETKGQKPFFGEFCSTWLLLQHGAAPGACWLRCWSRTGQSREEAPCGRPALLRTGADPLSQNINKSPPGM